MAIEHKKLGIIISPLDKTIFIGEGPALYLYKEHKRKYSASDGDILNMIDPKLPNKYNVLTAEYVEGLDMAEMVIYRLNMLYKAHEILGDTEWINLQLRMDKLEQKYSDRSAGNMHT